MSFSEKIYGDILPVCVLTKVKENEIVELEDKITKAIWDVKSTSGNKFKDLLINYSFSDEINLTYSPEVSDGMKAMYITTLLERTGYKFESTKILSKIHERYEKYIKPDLSIDEIKIIDEFTDLVAEKIKN